MFPMNEPFSESKKLNLTPSQYLVKSELPFTLFMFPSQGVAGILQNKGSRSAWQSCGGSI